MVISLATVRASSARSRQYFGSLIGTLAMGLLLEPIMATMRMIARLTLWDTVGASRVPLDAYSFGLAPASPPGLSFQGRLLPTFSGTCLLGVQSRSVVESAMLMLHSGRPYGTDSSRQRQDHARRPSCYTAIEGFDPRAR